jgi:hypothetical protein
VLSNYVKLEFFYFFCFCIFSIPQVFHFQKIPREEFSSFASSAAKSFFIVLHERTTFTINKTWTKEEWCRHWNFCFFCNLFNLKLLNKKLGRGCHNSNGQILNGFKEKYFIFQILQTFRFPILKWFKIVFVFSESLTDTDQIFWNFFRKNPNGWRGGSDLSNKYLK